MLNIAAKSVFNNRLEKSDSNLGLIMRKNDWIPFALFWVTNFGYLVMVLGYGIFEILNWTK